MDDSRLIGISSFLACNVGVLPFKFLGVPVEGNPRRVGIWKDVIESVKVRLSQWRSLKLSMGGRLVLINLVLESLPLYLFSMFKAPKKVVNEIERIQRVFLWGGNEDQKKMSWVKWNQVCRSKAKGGLGVKNLHLFNIALLAKWRWRLLNGNNSELWMRVLDARYGTARPWFGNELTVRVARRSSIWWRDLACIGMDAQPGEVWFKRVAKKRIGNGTTVKFWSDTWIGTEPLAELFPSVMAAHANEAATVAEMGEWVESRWKWKWDIIGQQQWLSVAEGSSSSSDALLAAFYTLMQDVRLLTTEEDRWIWMPDTIRGFSVNSCYNWLSEYAINNDTHTDEQVNKACASLWKSDFPSKVLVFGWRLLLRRLPVREELHRRGIISSLEGAMCVFCREDVETCEHLFGTCVIAKKVWASIFSWLNVQGRVEDDVVLMFKNMGDLIRWKGAKRVKWIFWEATVYQIWLARNNVIFNVNVLNVNDVVNSIKLMSWGWFIARRGRSSGMSYSDWFTCPLGCISVL